MRHIIEVPAAVVERLIPAERRRLKNCIDTWHVRFGRPNIEFSMIVPIVHDIDALHKRMVQKPIRHGPIAAVVEHDGVVLHQKPIGICSASDNEKPS